MECNKVRFALFRNRQRFLCLFVRRQQPIFKNLCDFRAGRAERGRAGHGSRHWLCCGWRFRRLYAVGIWLWGRGNGFRLCIGRLVRLLGRGVLLLRCCIRFFGRCGRRCVFHRLFCIRRWRSFFFGSLFRRFRRRIGFLAVHIGLFRRCRFLRFFRLFCRFYGFWCFLCLFLLRRFGWFFMFLPISLSVSSRPGGVPMPLSRKRNSFASFSVMS